MSHASGFRSGDGCDVMFLSSLARRRIVEIQVYGGRGDQEKLGATFKGGGVWVLEVEGADLGTEGFVGADFWGREI